MFTQVRGHEDVDLRFLGVIANGLSYNAAKQVLVGNVLVGESCRVTRQGVCKGVSRAIDRRNLELVLVEQLQPAYLPVVQLLLGPQVPKGLVIGVDNEGVSVQVAAPLAN